MSINYPIAALPGALLDPRAPPRLMASIAAACGAPPGSVPPLATLPPEALRAARTLILLVVDGLGARHLAEVGQGALPAGVIATHQSVFPSTTASAIPTFMTGLPPSSHALTGWHMWLDELAAVTAILPMTPRSPPTPDRSRVFADPETLAQQLFTAPTFFQQLPGASVVISPQYIAHSPFNARHSRGATLLGYRQLDELFALLATVAATPVAAGEPPRYVYAYWPDLDSCAHRHGIRSPQATATLLQFCRTLDAHLPQLRRQQATLLLTADHGFIDTCAAHSIDLADHPQLAATLARPLCGEPRCAWCYLHPGAETVFVDYVAQHLGHAMLAVPSRRLLAEHWLGETPAHPRLAARIGDYALLMKADWTIRDWLPGERRHQLIGVHGGLSDDEMRVPLACFN